MKIDRLELKHLAPYLLYNLNMYNEDQEGSGFVILKSGLITEFLIDQRKPILRPLSDLTKEIEVNGEKFVPLIQLFRIDNPNHKTYSDLDSSYYCSNSGTRFIYSSHKGTAAETTINIRDIDSNNYWKIQKLLEWNFDIFGLINSGLAIDINTLK